MQKSIQIVKEIFDLLNVDRQKQMINGFPISWSVYLGYLVKQNTERLDRIFELQKDGKDICVFGCMTNRQYDLIAPHWWS